MTKLDREYSEAIARAADLQICPDRLKQAQQVMRARHGIKESRV